MPPQLLPSAATPASPRRLQVLQASLLALLAERTRASWTSLRLQATTRPMSPPLVDFQLAEDRLQPDINLVPLVLEVAEGAFVQFAQITQGGGATQQRVHFVFGGACEFNPGDDHFQFLRQHALDLEELVFIFLTILLSARQAEVVVELLPALQIVFDLADLVVHFLVFHKVDWLAIILAPSNGEQGK